MENIMELRPARPRKSVVGFWVLVFSKDLSHEGASGADDSAPRVTVGRDGSLVFADHFHFPESAWGLNQALEQVEVAKQQGFIARIIHVQRSR